MSNTREKIMNTAEEMIRTRGYKGFAFRDVAAANGIKSASVHYHFPTKADLAVALMHRYKDQFSAALEGIQSQEETAEAQLEAFIGLYRRVVLEDRALTLCMMMGPEKNNLPEPVGLSLEALFGSNVHWLKRVIERQQPDLSPEGAHDRANLVHAAMQGGIIGAMATSDIGYFDRVARQIRQILAIQT